MSTPIQVSGGTMLRSIAKSGRRLVRIQMTGALVLTVACGGDAVTPDVDDTPRLVFDGSWPGATNFGGPWGHDGLPLETENFLIFSGTASQSARQFTANIAEESLGELMEWLDATQEDFQFLPSYASPKSIFSRWDHRTSTTTRASRTATGS